MSTNLSLGNVVTSLAYHRLVLLADLLKALGRVVCLRILACLHTISPYLAKAARKETGPT